MRAEADQADRRDAHQTEHCGQRDLSSSPRLARRERQERQQQPRRQLDADASGKRQCRSTQPRACRVRIASRWTAVQMPGGRAAEPSRRACAGAQHQRQCQRRDQHRVVVSAAHGQHQQHRVEAEEGHGEGRREAAPLRGPRGQRHRGQAEQRGRDFQRPQRAGEAQRRGRVAGEREQRPIGGVLERPADEAEHGVADRFGGEVRVGVEAVQRPHPRERHVAEHVLREQRWAEHQNHVRRHDRCREPPQRHRTRAEQRQRVAAADDEHQRLEAAAPQVRAEPRERSR